MNLKQFNFIRTNYFLQHDGVSCSCVTWYNPDDSTYIVTCATVELGSPPIVEVFAGDSIGLCTFEQICPPLRTGSHTKCLRMRFNIGLIQDFNGDLIPVSDKGAPDFENVFLCRKKDCAQ